MSRIGPLFASGGKALIAYWTVGYPTLEATLDIVPRLVAAGADLVELGIPFSDPLADGATIQKASFQALEQGVAPRNCLEVATRLRPAIGGEAPLVFMTYYNPVLAFGLEEFCRAMARAGLDGLIVPDLPPEEGQGLEEVATAHRLDLIYLLAPNSPRERISLVASRSRGFIYLVSLTGVTGARENLPASLEGFVAQVRQSTRKPLCVGFGVSSPEQARRTARIADGVIVGSRLLELAEEGPPYPKLFAFVRTLKEALSLESGN